MTSLKPTRTELIDMIIRKIYEKMINDRLELQRENKNIEDEINKLETQKQNGQVNLDKEKNALQADINEVLKLHGLSEISVHADLSKEFVHGKESGRIYPTFHISSSKGKARKAKPTKAIDRKISALRQQSRDLQGNINTVNTKAREFDLENKYKGCTNAELRSKVVQMLCETDDSVVKAVSNAAKKITEKTATELLETINAR